MLDIYGFRVIVHTLPECYLALGTLHQLYRPVPGKFKDYIAFPKVNGYQSLHTTLVGPYGTPVEFQFRTRDMHHVAEEGVASHWLYKGADLTLNDLQKRTHQWLQSLLDIQSQTGDSGEFLEHVKVDLFPDAVYVFTPRGKIISLPRGATPVDFAYAIHTDIGNQAVAAKVNGEFVPLRTEMSSGDTVEIVTSPASRPNAQWLNYVRTGRARSEIRHYLRTVKYEESVAFGERLLGQAMQELHMPLPATDDPAWQKLARSTGASSREEILADIGLGKRLAAVVARRFAPEHQLVATTAAAVDELTSARSAPILIQGNEGQAVQLAPCCGPRPATPSSPACAWATVWSCTPPTARWPCASACANRNAGSMWAGTRTRPSTSPPAWTSSRATSAACWPAGRRGHGRRRQHRPRHDARRRGCHGVAAPDHPGRQPQAPGPGDPRHPPRAAGAEDRPSQG